MARVTILGSGVIGLATAAYLSPQHEVTIVARDLPGDEPSVDWASPWAGATFIAGGCHDAREARMQIDTFADFWRWSALYPDAGIRRTTNEEVFDDDRSPDSVWWKDFMPDFRFLSQHELPKGAKLGVSYSSIVLNPDVFLPWLRRRLEAAGVVFRRLAVGSLAEAARAFGGGDGCDVLVNATGAGPLGLADVRDRAVERVRGQTILVRAAGYRRGFLRDDGNEYTYAISRLDGTVILGGFRQPGSTAPDADMGMAEDIVRRVHQNLPDHFPARLSDYEVIKHNVGLRPSRAGGIRLEKEVVGGQNVVHSYGYGSSGYIFSLGAGKAARGLVEDFLYPSATPNL